MKSLLSILFATLIAQSSFAAYKCTSAKGLVAKVDGLTMTIWNGNKCIETVHAQSVTRIPKRTNYFADANHEELLFQIKAVGGTVHQGGRVSGVRGHTLKYGTKTFHCN